MQHTIVTLVRRRLPRHQCCLLMLHLSFCGLPTQAADATHECDSRPSWPSPSSMLPPDASSQLLWAANFPMEPIYGELISRQEM